jgi:aromatic-amino-acid transaminase
MAIAIPSEKQDIILQRFSEYQNLGPSINKINGIIGVIMNSDGQVFIPKCFQDALAKIGSDSNSTIHHYSPVAGYNNFCSLVTSLLTDRSQPSDHWAAVQTPGGTGALQVIAQALRRTSSVQASQILISKARWPLYENIFSGSHFLFSDFYYEYDSIAQAIDLKPMLNAAATATSESTLVLQLSGHNPTGLRMEIEDWHRVVEVLKQNPIQVVIDIAYFGIGDCPNFDRQVIELFEAANIEFFVTFSFSKNAGLYGHRCGALLWHSPSKQRVASMQSYVKSIASGLWLSPPSYGAAVVTSALATISQREAWYAELAQLRTQITSHRQRLANILERVGLDSSQVQSGSGIFTTLPLTSSHIDLLYKTHSVFIEPNNGRFTVTSLTDEKAEYFERCLTSVVLGN